MAVEVADDLGLDQVPVPPNPGVISAYGLIAFDFSKIYAKTGRMDLDDSAADFVRQAHKAYSSTTHLPADRAATRHDNDNLTIDVGSTIVGVLTLASADRVSRPRVSCGPPKRRGRAERIERNSCAIPLGAASATDILR